MTLLLLLSGRACHIEHVTSSGDEMRDARPGSKNELSDIMCHIERSRDGDTLKVFSTTLALCNFLKHAQRTPLLCLHLVMFR